MKGNVATSRPSLSHANLTKPKLTGSNFDKNRKHLTMVNRCKICNVYSDAGKASGLSFHRLPADPIKRNIWISVLGLSENDNITKSSYICSKHFSKDDFVSKIGATDNARYLKRDAVSLPMHQVVEPKSTTRLCAMLVLDDDRLESMRCSKCRKYLSVFPVKNHPTSRDVTCGRCSSDGGVRSFLYELVAAEYLFRCVNRYEGCGKRLRVDETVAHERLCVGGAFSCPKCEDGVERSALELQWHYKIEHPSNYLHGTSRFDVSPQTSDVKLYIRDDIIAFISARYESDALHLAAATLKEMDVTQEFLVSRGQRLWERTERRPCKAIGAYGADRYILDMELPMSVEVTFALEASKGAELYDVSIPGPSRKPIEDGPKRKMFGVQAEADIEGMFGYKLNDRGTALLNSGGDEISLICSNCKHFIGLPVYRCHKANHQICEDCCTWCGICDDPKVLLTDSGDLIQKIGIHLKFPCKCKCGTYVNTNLRKHERSCKSRIFKCPMCLFVVSLSWSGLTFAKDHLKVSHGILNFLGNYDWSQIKNFVEQKHNGKLSFVKNDKCCYIKWTKAGGGLVDLNLGLCGDEPNIQMALINVSTRMKYLNVVQGACFKYWYYLPYIDFNHKK